METFLPLLHVLSFSSKQVRKLSQYLLKYQLPKEKFPLRAKIPLFFFMDATFHFENLVFTSRRRLMHQFSEIPVIEQDPADIFKIDQRIEELRKIQVAEHYKNLANHKLPLLSGNTEDAAKQQVTLTKLYAQLNHPSLQEEDEDQSDDSRGNADQLYRKMLEDDARRPLQDDDESARQTPSKVPRI